MTNHIRPEAYNASRGMAARATAYSRHSNRGGSADVVKSNRSVEAMDTGANSNSCFNRNNSGGRVRSLHLTSAENPFTGQQATTMQNQQQQQQQQQQLSDLKTGLLKIKTDSML